MQGQILVLLTRSKITPPIIYWIKDRVTIAPGAAVAAVRAEALTVPVPPELSAVLRESAAVFALSPSVFAVSPVEGPARPSAGQAATAEEAAGSVAAVVLPEAVLALQGWMFLPLPGSFSKLNSPWTSQQQGKARLP